LKKINHEKKLIKPIKILKKQPVRFGFISLKPKKPNRTEPKPKKNRAKPEKIEQN